MENMEEGREENKRRKWQKVQKESNNGKEATEDKEKYRVGQGKRCCTVHTRAKGAVKK